MSYQYHGCRCCKRPPAAPPADSPAGRRVPKAIDQHIPRMLSAARTCFLSFFRPAPPAQHRAASLHHEWARKLSDATSRSSAGRPLFGEVPDVDEGFHPGDVTTPSAPRPSSSHSEALAEGAKRKAVGLPRPPRSK